ncbi:uncharacterized protein LOC111023348 [Momordica charantia]|uniref:Uncharacterized protein LOC111023348 n=1 Tax=Momordica charantia TaxID=3673 RepID=A0A6J1DV12_MOMCH|nr:uncharacterized protein LOC111023348 [Momordica charantia]
MRRDPEKRNRSKFCHFHKDHRHNTSDRYDLKRQIKGLIHKGGGDGVGSSRGERTDMERTIPPKCTDRPVVINMIFEGPSRGQTGNKRKALAREARHNVCASFAQLVPYQITFSEEDMRGLHDPNNDALVIEAQINHMTVRCILIDGGASANILSFFTYIALGWDEVSLDRAPLR